ncbi:MAG: class I SAM-dependent methyltransferase [Anaerolineae bacterium]|nr:class I SAM-dependent methyltransferase [Anaerolineae bacterium]
MNNRTFNDYKIEFRAVIRSVLANSEEGRLDESGFPAYAHQNPLINWLFWQRLRKVMEYIEKEAPYARVLDFGCGSGVMLPFLCQLSEQVIAMDIDLVPFERVSHERAFPANLTAHDARNTNLKDLPKTSFDLIVAWYPARCTEAVRSALATSESTTTVALFERQPGISTLSTPATFFRALST